MTQRPYEPAPPVEGVTAQDVFVRTPDGITLAGTLRVPQDHPLPAPAILVCPPAPAAVSDQSVVAGYADRLAAAGFVTLALDPRGLGRSGGNLRQHFDAGDRIRDLQVAVSYLTTVPDIAVPDRTGVFGLSAGGTVALVLAGIDPRVRAFVGVCGGYFNPRLMRELAGDSFEDLRRAAYADLQRFHVTGEVDYIPVVTPDGGGGAFLAGVEPYPTEPFDYYGTARGASPWFDNRVTTISRHSLLNDDYLTPASFIGDRAGLLVAGTDDVYVPLEGAQEAFRQLTGPKDLVMVDHATHIDLYDNAPYVATAIDATVAWFTEHLR
jgi:fermentation-respiration switch protein FrsA (DUF1100 family)